MSPNPQFPADLVTLAEEILNGKLHFLCRVDLASLKSDIDKLDIDKLDKVQSDWTIWKVQPKN